MERETIVTMRCKDASPAPEKFGITTTTHCDRCGEEVWITSGERINEFLAQGAEVVCHVCIAHELAKGDDGVAIEAADKRFDLSRVRREDFLAYMMERGLRDG